MARPLFLRHAGSVLPVPSSTPCPCGGNAFQNGRSSVSRQHCHLQRRVHMHVSGRGLLASFQQLSPCVLLAGQNPRFVPQARSLRMAGARRAGPHPPLQRGTGISQSAQALCGARIRSHGTRLLCRCKVSGVFPACCIDRKHPMPTIGGLWPVSPYPPRTRRVPKKAAPGSRTWSNPWRAAVCARRRLPRAPAGAVSCGPAYGAPQRPGAAVPATGRSAAGLTLRTG